jgi:peptide/nickel transport system substrate-binding protein
MRRIPRIAVLGAALVLAMVVAACGDDSGSTDGGAASATTAQATTTSTTSAPVAGGSITVGVFSPPQGFDPIMSSSAHGTIGGMELMALYDTVVSWDPSTGDYVPRTAKSFEPNADHTVWTLTLKPGIKFTDGTAYDADAVKFNVERHTAPTSRSASRFILSTFVKSIDVVDPTTVKFTLNKAWTGFPFLFTRDVGLIASPTAIKAAGDAFNTTPGNAGAGPFMLKSVKPGESMVFEKNPNYYGGQVLLDSITFVPETSGAASAYEALKAGTLDAAFLRAPDTIKRARDEGTDTVLAERIPAGNVLDINAGLVVTCQGGKPAGVCDGKADGEKVKTTAPASDPRVRRAIAAAIDTSQVNERAYSGAAKPGPELFEPDFPLSPKVPGPKYDPAQARQLVDEAKAAGWNGSIRLFSVTDPTGKALGLAVSTMLQAAGIDVQLDSSFDPPSLLRKVLVDHDYDLVIWGAGFSENPDGNFVTALGTYQTGGAAARSGFSSAAFDQGVEALRVASTDAERTAAYGQLAQAWTDDVPGVALLELENALVTSPKLQGVARTSSSSFLFSGAWVKK